MKKTLFTLVGVMFFAVASFGQGKIKFDKMVHDFGKIAEGPIVYHTFKVTNTGTAPVVITNAQPSCGCTTPEWSKDPIMPGVTKTIKVGYSTVDRPNSFDKTITIISNAENATEVLRIKGFVTPKVKGTSEK